LHVDTNAKHIAEEDRQCIKDLRLTNPRDDKTHIEETKGGLLKNSAISNNWSTSSGACLQTLEGHSDAVNSVAFSHDSTRLASASRDRTVKIWDASGACLQTLEGHNGRVYSVAFSHDSTRLASASRDRTVKIWDASSGACRVSTDARGL
jgi:WD40 repeat protein